MKTFTRQAWWAPLFVAIMLAAGTARAEEYLGCGYDVIGASYIQGRDVKIQFPVLNKDKMVGDGLVDSVRVGEQKFAVFTASSLAEFYNERNNKIGLELSASVPFRGVLFSGGVATEFDRTLSEGIIDRYNYIRGRSYHYMYRVYIRRATVENLVNYLDEHFIADLRSHSAAWILDTYGSHVFTQYFNGGALEYNFTYRGTELTNEDEWSKALRANLAVKAPILGVSVGISSSLSQKDSSSAKELNENSEFLCRSYGGAFMNFSSPEQIEQNYNNWLRSINSGTTDICGIGKFDESFIPIWDLVKAIGALDLANKLKNEFYERANMRRDDLQMGKFALRGRDTTLIYSVASTKDCVYIFEKGLSATLEVYLRGGGGGGQGGHHRVQWFGIGKDRTGSGGAGGGGAAAYMKLIVPQSTPSLSVKVGDGGSGGNGSYVYNDTWKSGAPGLPGETTSIKVGSITLNAEGGRGGGGSGREDLQGGAGGVASPQPAGLLSFYSASGGNGGAGEIDGESNRRGGAGATIPAGFGPEAPFSGGLGAARGGTAGPGGGGYGGYHSDQRGGKGGSGSAIIVVKYPDVLHAVMFNTNGGTASPPITGVQDGARIAAPAAPERNGYSFAGWYVDRTATSAFNFNDAITNTTMLYAGWVPDTYTVTFNNADENGTIKATVNGIPIASGASVEHGQSVVFTATPYDGYGINGWTVNDEPVGGVSATYTLTDISESTDITVSFAKAYPVTFNTNDENGAIRASVDGSSITTGTLVGYGKKVVFTATPSVGYSINRWVINDEPVIGNTTATYTVLDVSEATTVTVSFVKTYIVMFVADNNGEINAMVDGNSITTGSLVEHGKSVLFTATPAEGYRVGGWTLNNAMLAGNTNSTYSILGISEAVAVAVSFVRITSVKSPDRVVSVDHSVEKTEEISVPPGPELSNWFTVGPNPVSKSSGTATIFRHGSHVENAVLLIYDAAGNLTRKVDIKDNVAVNSNAGRKVGLWDLKDAKGHPVSEGTYVIKSVVNTSIGKKEHVSMLVKVVR